ncbi:MAG: D-alanyl-D-alanine dipeptidase [Phycisphaerae bacterium]|nr:D-alanyl-D-alanine dipeptidase [Phycisphaerae bacterium]
MRNTTTRAGRPHHQLSNAISLGLACLALLVATGCASTGPKMVAAADVELVNLRDVDPTLIIDARYATADNFAGVRMYPKNEIFLERGAAEALKRVQTRLRAMQLGLKVLDGYRPHEVQRRLWEIMPDPRYVARPERGSRHNRGCAVDVTLVDLAGNELPMPTPFDEFSDRAHHDYMDLPPKVQINRAILRETMTAEGFTPLSSEWWHYDAPGWERFPILDVNPYGQPLFPDSEQ